MPSPKHSPKQAPNATPCLKTVFLLPFTFEKIFKDSITKTASSKFSPIFSLINFSAFSVLRNGEQKNSPSLNTEIPPLAPVSIEIIFVGHVLNILRSVEVFLVFFILPKVLFFLLSFFFFLVPQIQTTKR